MAEKRLTHTITVDLAKETWSSRPVLVQNSDNTFLITVLNDGEPADLSDVRDIVLAAIPSRKKANDSVFSTGVKVGSTSQVKVDLGRAAVATPGIVQAQLKLTGTNGGLISSTSFNFEVQMDAGLNFQPSENELTLIETVLGDGPTVLAEATQTIADMESTQATLTGAVGGAISSLNEDKAAAIEELDTAKTTAVNELAEVREANRFRQLDAVATVVDRDTTYPNPEHGDTVRVTSTATMYKYDKDAGWVVSDRYEATAVDALNQQLADTSVQVNQVEQDRSMIPYSRQKTKKVRNLISFYFDDAMQSDLTNVKTVTDAKGVPVNIAAISSYDGGSTYLSTEQLLQLQSEGWQIDSHTHNHKYLANLTDEEIDYELKTSRDNLRSRGLNISTITYPYGSYDARVMRIASKYYRAGLASVQGTNVIPLRTHEIRRVHMKDYTLDNMKSRIDSLNNGWIVFYGHSNPNWTQEDTDKLAGLIDYAQSKNIEIVTVDEALDTFGNAFEVVDPESPANDNFKIGADGKVYSPELNKLNHVYLAPTNITNATPVTDFERLKVTSVSFTSASASGIPIGNGAGTLLVYRINWDDVLNFQMFIPHNNSGIAIRYWTASGWGSWKQHGMAESGTPIRHLGMNAYPASDGIGALSSGYSTGVTMFDVNSSGSTGYPASAGSVYTYKSNQGAQWSYQRFDGYQSHSVWKRYAVGVDTWSTWTKISSV